MTPEELIIWNKAIEFSKHAVTSVMKDWQEVGAFTKVDAADYILRVIESCKRD